MIRNRGDARVWINPCITGGQVNYEKPYNLVSFRGFMTVLLFALIVSWFWNDVLESIREKSANSSPTSKQLSQCQSAPPSARPRAVSFVRSKSENFIGTISQTSSRTWAFQSCMCNTVVCSTYERERESISNLTTNLTSYLTKSCVVCGFINI